MKQKKSIESIQAIPSIEKATTANTNPNPVKINQFSKKEYNITKLNEAKPKQYSPKKSKRKTESSLKNINEYRHLFENNIRFVNADLEWTLDLRDYKKQNIRPTSASKQVPPTFYDEDLKKYKAKKKDRSQNAIGNWSKYYHLTRNCLSETTNQTQFQFATTLRSFRPMATAVNHHHKWSELPYKVRNDAVTFLSPMTDREKEALAKIDKYTMRPYITTYEKVLVDKDYVRKKKLIPNKTVTLGEYGDHLALRPYSSNYQDKNIMIGKNVYAKHTNTLCLFEMGMRMYGKREESQTQIKPFHKYHKKEKEQIDVKDSNQQIKY